MYACFMIHVRRRGATIPSVHRPPTSAPPSAPVRFHCGWQVQVGDVQQRWTPPRSCTEQDVVVSSYHCIWVLWKLGIVARRFFHGLWHGHVDWHGRVDNQLPVAFPRATTFTLRALSLLEEAAVHWTRGRGCSRRQRRNGPLSLSSTPWCQRDHTMAIGEDRLIR